MKESMFIAYVSPLYTEFDCIYFLDISPSVIALLTTYQLQVHFAVKIGCVAIRFNR